MRPGRAFDTKIAIKIMGLTAIEPENIPYYTTDIFDAHKVISKLQTSGWLCNVSSMITDDGNLYYRAKFYQQGRECEKTANTIPMAICVAALAVINNEYFDYVDVLKKKDSSPIEILGKNKNTYSVISFDDEHLVNVINMVINENPTNIAKKMVDTLKEQGYIILKLL